MTVPRIAVVGAGFAGSMAAADLASAGFDVVVFEARNRAGGRVWSHEMDDGLVVEMGAELVEDWYVTMRGLVDEFGLSLIPGPERFLRFPFFAGPNLVAAGPHGIIEPVEEALRRLAMFVREADPPLTDQMSVGAGLDRIGLGGLARRWFDALVSGWSCREQTEESLLAFAETRVRPLLIDGISPPRWARRIVGGNDQIAKRLLQPLHDRIHFNHIVRGVTWRHRTADVHLAAEDGGRTERVDAVVLAAPFPALERVDFQPPLPNAVRSGISRIDYGLGAKAVVRYVNGNTSPDLFLSEAPRFHAWRSGDRPGADSVTLYVGGDATRSLAALPQQDWNGEALARLSVSHPHLAAAALEVKVAVWSADPLTATCGTVYRPGAFLSRERWLGEPIDSTLYFAGEHTSTDAFGTMEGALRTGRRAAAEVVSDWR